uniref:50S ribosomal protein L33 n=1 Tax=Nitzschia alba TaxID=2858 RepID=A0A5C0F4Y6_NITAL|nr:50S ribosomal protein L33 [Nitzschia alba]QEI59585.1 50S ribosomal protein L33 [Nitzschia alba]
MKKRKRIRSLVTLECVECYSNIKKRSLGISRYLTQKNRLNNPERLNLKKYCKYCNKSSLHKELK